ncbi:hypothetical protein LOZ61_004719 [Ophidiomyces ophidiicola]|uniref:Uncharacterized protein n=1 Tax=Ophidiomyces ophidiicola TaxID=1387563 RepID=A0ACB8UVN6_9EURO|nr:uncharacterized protein LOZ57_006471 [Ophidiomyces ophidiicola]KAI1909882.1 hypothetical protein LOZ61_004719 [Ophidiomyces ophidiicola]KAI1924088.1 hypothetical protein LOZ64_000830 [Ophidiomyces ophidiicola]KAI1925036.1 hypothetical protein LOZ60_004315 [Ophidiomyces ophidiicola]KAI1937922.1 hypothetical protein LOZ57_006471 [Ophidiomyces ophidiicola]KAI2010667.1 hypothetical protein LOZ49_003404 [Ophidiomyces ophidiicola]
MASIASLLNPEPEPFDRFQQLPTPCSNLSTDFEPQPQRQKKQKISKDAAVFTRGEIKGELRYPPCEFQDEKLAEAHKKLDIYPMGCITQFPRHIPYNSEKKSFLERTGRESFEGEMPIFSVRENIGLNEMYGAVFQYTFQMPGEDTRHTVMWDYNIGLVRTTSFFKCNNYSKAGTAPGKMLDANPGLRDICHSITGGALAAQGYWMPFEAAKAVAATFCWKIRYALTPLFGVQFLDICIPPNDARFGKMVIDPEIVQTATITAENFRSLELERHSLPCELPNSVKNESLRRFKNLRPRSNKESAESNNLEENSDGEYNGSNLSHPTSGWTSANAPSIVQRSSLDIPSPKDILVSLAGIHETVTRASPEDNSTPQTCGASEYGDESFIDTDSVTSSSESDAETDNPTEGKYSPLPLRNDIRAAYMLLKMQMDEDSSIANESQRKRRRASA